jgi:hypothetical protein
VGGCVGGSEDLLWIVPGCKTRQLSKRFNGPFNAAETEKLVHLLLVTAR